MLAGCVSTDEDEVGLGRGSEVARLVASGVGETWPVAVVDSGTTEDVCGATELAMKEVVSWGAAEGETVDCELTGRVPSEVIVELLLLLTTVEDGSTAVDVASDISTVVEGALCVGRGNSVKLLLGTGVSATVVALVWAG